MLIAITTFPNEGRKLKHFVQWLIMSGAAACVNRINYLKSYYVREDEFQQKEEKLLLIKFPIKNKEKLIAYFKKNHPYKMHELIFVKPEDVDENYLKRVQDIKPFKNKK